VSFGSWEVFVFAGLCVLWTGFLAICFGVPTVIPLSRPGRDGGSDAAEGASGDRAKRSSGRGSTKSSPPITRS
jgi:hypothetical protein